MVGECPSCGTVGAIERPYIPVEGHRLFAERSVAACPRCRLRYCEPMPSDGENLDYYVHGDYDPGTRDAARMSGHWDLSSLRATAQVDLVMRTLGRMPKSWLDIGAGYGLLLDEAKARGVARTGGTEPTPVRLADLQARGHEGWADVAQVEPAWDIVSFSHVIEHIVDPHSFVKACADLLADGGVIFCEVPNVPLEKPDPDEPHVLFFVPESLSALFERAGLNVMFIGEAGRRTGKGWDRLTKYTSMAKRSGRLPARLNRLDAMHRYGSRQGRIYLRCVARPK